MSPAPKTRLNQLTPQTTYGRCDLLEDEIVRPCPKDRPRNGDVLPESLGGEPDDGLLCTSAVHRYTPLCEIAYRSRRLRISLR